MLQNLNKKDMTIRKELFSIKKTIKQHFPTQWRSKYKEVLSIIVKEYSCGEKIDWYASETYKQIDKIISLNLEGEEWSHAVATVYLNAADPNVCKSIENECELMGDGPFLPWDSDN